ncbi:MAG: endo-1,4-beta-xylanase [Eubacterium sp.]|nr:endo-1,4-beta-xylanase [Eubacterium sp.]
MKRRMIAKLLAGVMLVSVAVPATTWTEAAKKPVLSKRSIRLEAGKKTTLKVKTAKKARVTWKSSKKSVVSIGKKTKKSAQIIAKKKGTAKISCKVRQQKKKFTLVCKVKVTKAKVNPVKTTTPTVIPSTVPAASGTPAVSAKPSATPSATPEVTLPPLKSDSILENYEDVFGHLGTCVNYGSNPSTSQLQDEKTLAFVKKHFNSITMENEMKPDAVLGSKVTMITKEEAEKLGYIIPDNYKETSVPKLNFDRIDKILQIAYDNGLGLRGHTLLWHSQTPAWFFGIDYDADEDAVDEDTMDARIDFYVSTVMDHVMQKEKEIAGETGKIVYAWDVVNEYLHRGRAWSLNWTSVYGDMKGTPSYVKRAFERAYEMLEKYDATDKVTLFYNDYDTYFEVEDLLALVNFINEGEKAKICSGIGMQSHVDIKRPTIEEYGAALEKFMAAGYEVQITELDFTINFDTDGTDKKDPSYDYKNEGETIEEQAAFVKDFMEMVIAKQKNRDKTVSPKGITGLTIWGLYDSISWRGKSQPLLFGTSIDDPKPAFQAFLEASRTK